MAVGRLALALTLALTLSLSLSLTPTLTLTLTLTLLCRLLPMCMWPRQVRSDYPHLARWLREMLELTGPALFDLVRGGGRGEVG